MSSDKVPPPISPSKSRRQLRERKQRKLYSEEWTLGDDDYEGARGFSVAEKLESPRFAQSGMVREMKGENLTVGFLQQNGFNIPLLFKEKTGLGLQVPSSNFSIGDVRTCVGSRRTLDVMDVNTQKNIEMTMKDWEKYYEDPVKKKLLNVISLEFSHTRLENYVQSPAIVRQIDWVDVVWPKQLKESQVESTNLLNDMMYPKVQKYCLMSVKNCYTDFHVDFGGTSVWYHILRGSKVFWLIPPTEKNLQLYEKWVLSGKQSDVFFGDTVEKCARVYLTAGNTFFIPTGWIHAVYTPTDSLVFGGNFLHSFGIVKQLKIAQVEDNTKVPQKFRYPFFTEMLWYVLAKYVYTLLGHAHLVGEKGREHELHGKPHVHLTHYELFGLKDIVMYLYDLPAQRKNVPKLIRDPVAVIKDVRTLVERHCKDSPELAVTGVPVLHPDLNISNNSYIREHYEYYSGDGTGEGGNRSTDDNEDQEAAKSDGDEAADGGCENETRKRTPEEGKSNGISATTEQQPLLQGESQQRQIIVSSGNGTPSGKAGGAGGVLSSHTSPTQIPNHHHHQQQQQQQQSQKHSLNRHSHGTAEEQESLNRSRSPIGSSNSGTTMGPPSRQNHYHHAHHQSHHPQHYSGNDDDRNFVSPQPTSGNRFPSVASANGAGRGPYKKHSPGVGSGSVGSEKRDSGGVGNGGAGGGSNNGPRRRRTRCKTCEACQRSDCGECSFCLDMVKFGGPGRAKQTCMMRQCLQPMLPVTAQCIHCQLDGWRQAPITAPAQAKLQAQLQDGPSALMECSVCYEISHPDCAQRVAPEVQGVQNDDLPNSWECPTCCKSGKNTDYRPRHFRARMKSSEIRRISVSSDASSVHNADLGRMVAAGGGMASSFAGGSTLAHGNNSHSGGEGGSASDGPNSGAGGSVVTRVPRFENDMLYDFAVSGKAVIVGGNGGNILFERKIKDEDVSSGSENDTAPGRKLHQLHAMPGGGSAVKMEIKHEPMDHQPPTPHGQGAGAFGGHHHTTSVIRDGRELQQQHQQQQGHGHGGLSATSGSGIPVKRRKSEENGTSGGASGAGLVLGNHQQNHNSPAAGNGAIGGSGGGATSGNGAGGNDGHEGGKNSHSLPRKKSTQRTQLAHQIHSTSTKQMKKPLYPIRPAALSHTPGGQSQSGNYALDANCLLPVFRYLPPETLVTCTLVCKTWSNIAVDPTLWKRMSCVEYKLTPNLLSAIVRRQPEHLIMDWIGLGKRQVTWLISRIPGLKNLSLQGTHIQAVLGLHTCMCPPLQVLDLSFIGGLNDFAIREILSAPKDSRPGLADSKSRLRNLKMLKVAGADISDVALRYITQGLPNLTHLDLSSCQRITDAAIAQIGTSPAAIKTLVELDLSCCKLITELSLDHLAKCDALTRLDLSHVPQVSTQAVIKFASTSKNDLQLHDIKLVDKRKAPAAPPPVPTSSSST
ncbi:jmjC domain-containing histone demethylation protein 1 [Anopheles darlingi]|uniref:jmjC domain-containing histone demethylation protein 1 n=1 Tax=Anopheles darlingi TaxID=43151 RepID=UPI0021006639|nr:jmjC domain-containing histone demethylation protein 1 [Anopheles darlingi]XP_049529880.1 jmjC domain-containing histone demethylation protein 1 [Anopheles darlingi]XP_049529881.1 jmjC domain-containing histone demethylation protein 1 [Anopheles darlingi]XP_049529882.1 jmjC domain-containing histone demethylation protein 1 [Anopheles darlingi]XP_049529883.1 jmjC domain-containing histone demethylation protein 1 [Anopheles darlingi]XP_049529884.1 jmjC domain-containing histone demethylation 